MPTGGAAKVHQLIPQPIGFKAARGSAVDEQMKLRETWAAIWRANTLGPALTWPEDDGLLFPYACSAGFVALRQRCGRPPTRRVSFGPRTRAASSVVSGSGQLGVNGPQRTGTWWLEYSTICSKLSIMWRTRS